MGFSLPNLEPTGTVRFVLTGIRLPGAPGDLALHMKHAGKGNPGWEKARRKVEATLKARTGAVEGEALVAELLEPFAKHIITDWDNAYEDGKPVTCSPAKCAELLGAIVAQGGIDFVDQAMSYAMARANFRDFSSTPEELGKE